MELLLLLFLLVPFCGGDGNSAKYCHGKPCPNYNLVQRYNGFEEREYNPSKWITTAITSTTFSAAAAAHSRLKAAAATLDTWPVLVSVDNNHYKLSWFIPPGTPDPDTSDPLVSLENRPAVTVYVRVFGKLPSIEEGRKNAKILCDDLVEAEIPCAEPNVYDGAGYDPLLSFSHHNELWIKKAD